MAEKEIQVTLTYPHSHEYEFLSKIEIIDLDKEARLDIDHGTGFLITDPRLLIDILVNVDILSLVLIMVLNVQCVILRLNM